MQLLLDTHLLVWAQANTEGQLLITAGHQLAAYPGPVHWMAAASPSA